MRRLAADTIFALSSGSPPAGIAIIRISGPRAGAALQALAGVAPAPRQASYRALTDPDTGELLDRALILWFPGPSTATGEDLAELHLHGGRSVVAGVLESLGRLKGLRGAEAGEFTRRAFENGRIDLAEAEGLADLLSAETAAQRRSALNMAGGRLSRRVEAWQERLLRIAAHAEAALDFSDEGDVDEAVIEDQLRSAILGLAAEMAELLASPAAEKLKDGLQLVIAGPPNAGKSSLINALAGRDVAIVSDIAGTTRDRIEAPVALSGVAFTLTDTAGIRESSDPIEAAGVERARDSLAGADMILWLGGPEDAPEGNVIRVLTKVDLGREGVDSHDIAVSALTGEGLDLLVQTLLDRARGLLPLPDQLAINERQRCLISGCFEELRNAAGTHDILLMAEHLRLARTALDAITGRAGVEDLLDSLFGSFCIGK